MIDIPLQLGKQGSANFFSNGIDAQLKFETGSTLNILKSTRILAPKLADNVLGMYTYVDVDGDGTARFGSFKTSEHNLRSRDASCTWNPNGTMTFGIEAVNTCAKQYQNEMCSSVLWDSCWEKLLGAGMGKLDFDSDPQAQKFFKSAVDEIMIGIGNDFYDVVNWSNHPNITLSETNNYWIAANVDPATWTRYYAQQIDANCSGLWTTAEKLKTVEGYDHFNVEILESNTDGEKYIGSAMDLFDTAIAAGTSELNTWELRVGRDPDIAMPIIHVSQGIFNKYKNELRTSNTNNLMGFQLMTEGEKGIGMPYRNVLMYDGYWVIARPDFTRFDKKTGITSHIIAVTAPGVLGIASDVSPQKQFEGMGMVITKRPGAPFNKTYFEALFRFGGMILDHRFMTYGSLFLPPTV